ncbi:Hypothetical_protein [Hexamita inflata]|uniref:Hypothetical_protein n=1 Tax=Hexamita inflata TaxID=28002 RepID=A0AA86QPT2_9EUKA|nr:Hypothetical protein HINF_LOCUS50015 [Hexamita inflata]
MDDVHVVLLLSLDGFLDRGRGQLVVGVEKDHELGGEGHAEVPGVEDPSVPGERVELDVGVLVRVGLDDLGGVVGRAVVDDDHVSVRVGLGEGVLERVLDAVRGIEGGSDNRYLGLGWY